MRVLITGITGFAGGHLARHCAELGNEVHGLVRPGREAAAPAGATAHAADLGDAAAVAGLLERLMPDRVLHLAGHSSVGRSFGEPAATWEANLGGTLAVLEALRAVAPATRTLVVTSGEAYGRVPADGLPVGPDTPFRPLSPYGASKAAADLAAAQYRAGYGLPVVRVRAFNHIGPGQDARFVLPNVARQIARAERAGADGVEVRVGNVDTRRDFTDVRDMVRAYMLLADAGDPDVAYLGCSGRSTAVRDLVGALAGQARIGVSVRSDAALRRAGEQADLYGAPGPLRDELGWSPAIPLTTTLSDTLDWWRARVAEEE